MSILTEFFVQFLKLFRGFPRLEPLISNEPDCEIRLFFCLSLS